MLSSKGPLLALALVTAAASAQARPTACAPGSPRSNSKALVDAVLQERIADSIACVRAGVDPQSDAFADAAHAAVELGDESVVKAMIEAYPEIVHRSLGTSGYLIVTAGKISETLRNPEWVERCFRILKLLVEAGADVNAQDPVERTTALHEAVRRCGVRTTRFLVEHGAKTRVRDFLGNSPINDTSGCYDSIANWDAHVDHDGIDRAATAITQALIEHGADINAHGNEKSTALHFFAQYDLLGTVAFALEHGADVNALSDHGTPMDSAEMIYTSRRSDVSKMKKLLKFHGGMTAEQLLKKRK